MRKAICPIDYDPGAANGDTEHRQFAREHVCGIRVESESEQEIIGESRHIKQLLYQIETVAPTDATTLILGRSGTGKELVARMIHARSSRNNKSFIEVNCAAIPRDCSRASCSGTNAEPSRGPSRSASGDSSCQSRNPVSG